MIVSQTPYRVSLGGGGSDLPAFYRQEVGAVVACAVQQSLHVAIAPRLGGGVRLDHGVIEEVQHASDLPNRIVGESLMAAGIEEGIQIWTAGEVPPGTGLGSSSALAVGMTAALACWNDESLSPEEVARRACAIEIDRLGGALGKQDQTIAAHGGLCFIEFHPDESVRVERLALSEADLAAFEARVLIFYTGKQRAAGSILAELAQIVEERRPALRALRDHAVGVRDALAAPGGPCFELMGRHLHEAWMQKRALWPGSSTREVDDWYTRGRAAGALGGRLLGAGSGGFVLFLAHPDDHAGIRAALDHPLELPFHVSSSGVRVHDLRAG